MDSLLLVQILIEDELNLTDHTDRVLGIGSLGTKHDVDLDVAHRRIRVEEAVLDSRELEGLRRRLHVVEETLVSRQQLLERIEADGAPHHVEQARRLGIYRALVLVLKLALTA